jgi:uncharacterized UPF0160 family protein
MSTKILDIIRNAYPQKDTITLVTHKGKFHSDDVMATAILKILFEKELKFKTNLVRTFTPKEDGYDDNTPNTIVYDIGLGQYDHHQVGEDAKHCIRLDKYLDEYGIENTVIRKHAAVGLIWNEIGVPWIGEKYAPVIYDTIIRYIDDHDNGFGHNPLSTLISNFNPNILNPTDKMFDDSFKRAVFHCMSFFMSTIAHYKFIQNCEGALLIAVANSDGVCLVTDYYLPGADDICRERHIPFYVYPNQRGGWCFKTISVSAEDMNTHICDIPDEVRDWEDVTFLHPSCFLGSAVTKERAIEICHKILFLT